MPRVVALFLLKPFGHFEAVCVLTSGLFNPVPFDSSFWLNDKIDLFFLYFRPKFLIDSFKGKVV